MKWEINKEKENKRNKYNKKHFKNPNQIKRWSIYEMWIIKKTIFYHVAQHSTPCISSKKHQNSRVSAFETDKVA